MRSRHLQFGLTLLLALSGLSLAPMAGAWGVDGHRVIGEFAQSQLSPNARAEVGRLLSLEPGATLGSIANPGTTSTWHAIKTAAMTRHATALKANAWSRRSTAKPRS
ncbi:MAG: hypothetical protein EBT08_05365 [Betaproteobacteria bacterium]|nr:hypothetical protein [Betaproteobacteria bacterium]